LLGLPVNVWTAIATLIVGFAWIVVSRLRHRTQETGLYTHGARTLLRRVRRGKHTFEVNASNIADVGNPVHPQQLPVTPRTGAGFGPRQKGPDDPDGGAGAREGAGT